MWPCWSPHSFDRDHSPANTHRIHEWNLGLPMYEWRLHLFHFRSRVMRWMWETVLVFPWDMLIEHRLEFIRVPSMGSSCGDSDFRCFSQSEFAEECNLQKNQRSTCQLEQRQQVEDACFPVSFETHSLGRMDESFGKRKDCIRPPFHFFGSEGKEWCAAIQSLVAWDQFSTV